MSDSATFAKFVAKGQPTGEVIAINRFLVTVRGLGEIPFGALVFFENGHRGLVREVHPETVLVLNITSETIPIGTLAVLEADELTIGVGDAVLGRVLNVNGQPVDGKGPLSLKETDTVFKTAPGIIERQALSKALPTGVAIVDQLFPLVQGQRIAVLGDNKTGKSTFVSQLTRAQSGSGRIVIHVLISKRKADVDKLLTMLHKSGAIKYSVIVVATVLDSLTQSYIAPYVGATLAEYFWRKGKDCIIIYDDLSNHAKVYRELALLLKVSPGRASYPGDLFYAHSSLLERAGRLAENGATLAAVPIVAAPNNDITAPLPTAVMSITDGQLIFDSNIFRSAIRPAVSVGLSVSRVGGIGQTRRQQQATGLLFQKLAAYRQALEFSHFGSELAAETRADLALGTTLYEALKQAPDTIYPLNEQDLIIGTILKSEGKVTLDVEALKKKAHELAPSMRQDSDWDKTIQKLLTYTTVKATTKPKEKATA